MAKKVGIRRLRITVGLIVAIAVLLFQFGVNDGVTSLGQIPFAIALSVVAGFLAKWLVELAAWGINGFGGRSPN